MWSVLLMLLTVAFFGTLNDNCSALTNTTSPTAIPMSTGDFRNNNLTLTAGVFVVSKAGSLTDLEKLYPAIEIAAEKANRNILSDIGVNLNVTKETYGNVCAADGVTGRASVLFQKGNLIAL